ncbi:MAG: nitrilase-related carbon-nitrogen hydrolase [Nevskiales bacterium]
MKRIVSMLAACAASAVMLWFGTGLQPVWWLTWLAPLPVLWIVPRLSATGAFALATLAWAAGAANEWNYAHRLLEMPPQIIALMVLVPSLVFGVAVLLWRRLLLRGALLQAALAFAGVIVSFGFAQQRLSPHSTWGDIAYSQMDFLPLLQTASLAGVAGVAFLLLFLPASLAAAWCGPGTSRHRRAVAAGAVLLVVAAVGWGASRLGETPGRQVKVGLIASDLVKNLSPKDPERKKELFAGYSAKAAEQIAQGAQLVIVPEKLAEVPDADIAEVDLPFQQAAAQGAVIAVGLERWSAGNKLNESRIYGPQGTLWTTYEKHHMLPAFEGDMLVGTTRTVLDQPSGKWGVAICKDLDFPQLSREYGNDGIGLLVVSAWDFVADAWLHDRMAVMRGVESGFSLARSSKDGLLSLSDDRGRVLVQARAQTGTGADEFYTLLGEVPVHHDATLYARWADWFSWLVLAGLILILLNALRSATPARN